MNTTLWFQGLIYFLLGALGPLQALYSTDAAISTRNIIAASIGGLISGLAAVKAYMSTTYSDSGAADVDAKPKAVVIEQPASKPVPTTETAAPVEVKPNVVTVTRKKRPPVNVTRRPR